MSAGSSSTQSAQDSYPRSGEDCGDSSNPSACGSGSQQKRTTSQTLWSTMKHKYLQPEHKQQPFSGNQQLKRHASSCQLVSRVSNQFSLQETCVERPSNPPKLEACGKSQTAHRQPAGCKQTQKGDGFMPPCKKQKMDITAPDAAFKNLYGNIARLLDLAKQAPSVQSMDRGASHSALKAMETIQFVDMLCDSTLKNCKKDTTSISVERGVRQRGAGHVREPWPTHQRKGRHLKLKMLWQRLMLKHLNNAKLLKSRQKRSESLLKFLSKVIKSERRNDHLVDGHSLASVEEALTTSHVANNTVVAPICVLPEESPLELPPQESPPPPDLPRVYLEREGQWERQLQSLPMEQYVVVFRFVNLEHLSHPMLAQKAIYKSIQGLLNEMRGRVQELDLVQLQLEGGGLSKPLHFVWRPVGGFPADEFINQMANLIQSDAENHLQGSLHLAMTVIRNRGGKARRVISKILQSEVIHKKKHFLLDPNNTSSNLCFGISLLGIMAENWVTIPELAISAHVLYSELGFSDEQKILLSDVATFEKHLKVNIGVVINEGKGWQIFRSGPPLYPQTYFLLLHDDHYYGVRNLKAFFGQRNYCAACGNVYSHSHSCKYRCRLCLAPHCDLQQEKRCPNCKVYCKSRACFKRHTALANICKAKIFCHSCLAYVPKEHTCNMQWCKQCKEPLGEVNGHQCFMSSVEPSKITNKYIFYNFECMQQTGIHTPNYIIAMGVEEWDNWEFKGADCISDFVKKFVNNKYQGYTFLAHNVKGYNSYLIVRQMLVEKVDVDLVTQGGKLMCVTAKKLGIRFLDSSNFLPMKLAKLPQAMGFEGFKGFLPHFFNSSANWGNVGPVPKMEDYGVDNMMPGEKAEFLSCYQENQGAVFNLQKNLAYYCQQDVKILRKACLLYREDIISMSGIDAFHYITLPHVCMAMYRHMFLKPGTIALLPHDNYHTQIKRSSTPSIQWLLYLEHKEDVEIQHALKGGEVKVGPYCLDGYAVVGECPTAFEFNDCFFRGCPTCFSPTDRNPITNSTFGDLHDHTQMKVSYLRSQGFVVRHLWEHEWHEMVNVDRELGAFLRKKELPLPLLPRDALFGGQTNAICLYYKAKAAEKIHYYDFTSLYPFVKKTMKYPIGHPKIIYKDFGPLSKYFGLAKVKVHPPRGLFFPVLPFEVEDKVLFPLCRTCAEAKMKVRCEHSVEERALEGTWCTVELMKALEKGYRVVSISEVWHFEESSDGLFSDYIKLHLRQNQESSGYPSWCTDAGKKEKYIQDYLNKEGVQLRAVHIAVNPAKHHIAKLFLNSLWGQQSSLVNTSIVKNPTELLQYAFSPSYEVSGFEVIDDETASVSWKHAKDSFNLSEYTNVLIDCFTMAYARLQLYDVLDKLQDRCLYHGTDSVIFVSQDGNWNPPLGNYLGELTSKIPPDQYITEFTSVGPNIYGYRLSGGKVCMKTKGITLNVPSSEKINFDSLKDLVLDDSSEPAPKAIQVQQPSIMGDRNQWLIQTESPKKMLKDIYDTRVIVDDFKTLPYGF